MTTTVLLANLAIKTAGFCILISALLSQFKTVKHRSTVSSISRLILIGLLIAMVCFEFRYYQYSLNFMSISLLVVGIIMFIISKSNEKFHFRRKKEHIFPK